jgi:hypothetical protein
LHEAASLSPSAIIDFTMDNWRTVTMPTRGALPTTEQISAAIAAIEHGMETCPGAELPPLGQDREYEVWVAEYARFAVGFS